MLKFRVVFKFCFFILFFSLDCINLNDSLNKSFKTKLRRLNVDEPHVYILLFDGKLILIGAILNYSNLDTVLWRAKKMFSLANKETKTCNLLIYKFEPENYLIKQNVFLALKKNTWIYSRNYKIYTMGRFVWVIGYARTCYEKDAVKNILSLLRARKKIDDFYCFIRIEKNSAKGFVYRHIV